ncbi:MAG: pyridine nucleotide-disulfide oxidoreductase [Christensenellales bacterium]
MKAAIVGGVAGGATAAAGIRRLKEDAEIIILEKPDIFHMPIVVFLII